jgi:hypothetical protein
MLVPPVIVLLCEANTIFNCLTSVPFPKKETFIPTIAAARRSVQTDSIGAAEVVHDQPASELVACIKCKMPVDREAQSSL